MEKRLAHSWEVAELASIVGLSTRQLERIFKAATGQSPMQYLHGLRLEQACELLLTTFLSGKQLATRVGFQDERYFYREFKRAFGVSALTYRQQQMIAAPPTQIP